MRKGDGKRETSDGREKGVKKMREKGREEVDKKARQDREEREMEAR